jgi:hypothetical protein
MIKMFIGFMQSTRYSCQILMKCELVQKILKYNISWKSVQWELSCSMRKDRQTFLNFAKAPKTAET